MAGKNDAMKSALKSLMMEMGSMNMDRVRKMKMPPESMEEEKPELAKMRKKILKEHHARVRMGDPGMDD